MNNEIIVVKQLPVIDEQLQAIKAEVTAKVTDALSLVCTEETVKDVKAVRAELNKQLKDFEERRKAVKKSIMTPYEAFEAVYKDCISDTYRKADAELKGKVDAVENELKAKRETEIREYFAEYLLSSNVDFLSYERAGINITLSASTKSLKEQAKAFIDRVCDDLNLIETQEHKEEILVEYKNSLNVSAAITTVINRHKAIEQEKAREEERQKQEKEAAASVEKVEQFVEAPAVIAPPVVEEPVLTVAFKVTATKTKLKALKEFLKNGGYDYE